MVNDLVSRLLADALANLAHEFRELPHRNNANSAQEMQQLTEMRQVLSETAHKLKDNYPYFHPLYAGQMLKPPHPVAHAAYALAMAINPNNHARDGGRASSEMELEVVRDLAAIFDWPEHLGHLTSGGTFANLEALWVAGQQRPGKCIVGSTQAHYTHPRISSVLKLDYRGIEADARGRMDLNQLEDELRTGDVGTVVATMGTTAIGAVDPLDEIVKLRDRYGFRIHADAAYGGYFRLIRDQLGESARRAYQAMETVDSVVLDPHKHGLQPYGCGSVLFRDPSVGQLYKHDSPYTYFTSTELHLGEISLECSRAGASAVALWATHRLLAPVAGGAFAHGLSQGRRAALELHRRIAASELFTGFAAGEPDLDIVVWQMAAASAGQASQRARSCFAAAATRDLHLALVQLPHSWFMPVAAKPSAPATTATCLRSVLMKPEHAEWLDAIWDRLESAARQSVAEEAGGE